MSDEANDSIDVLSVTMVARILGVARQRVHQLMREGRIVGTWTGSNWVFTRQAVAAYQAQAKEKGGPGRRAAAGPPVRARRPKRPPEPADEIGRLLAQVEVVAQLDRARAKLSDPQARNYVMSTLRALWQTPMSPDELAAARGASGRTLTRLRAVFRALRDIGLLMDAGHDRLVVDHAYLNTLT